MSYELQYTTGKTGNWNEIPADFPKVVPCAQEKFRHEIESLVTAWKKYADELAKTDREESNYRAGCCYQTYERRYTVCPTASIIGGAAVSGGVTALAFKEVVACATAAFVFGVLVGSVSLAVATVSCLSCLPNTQIFDSFTSRKSSSQFQKDTLSHCVNYLNRVGELLDNRNKSAKDLSETDIPGLFAALENVQNAERTLLTPKAKETEKLFLMEDIVRSLKMNQTCADIVKIWETFKSSAVTTWGDKNFTQPLEKFGLHQFSNDSYLHFFIALPHYTVSETQVGNKISAAQVYVRSITAA